MDMDGVRRGAQEWKAKAEQAEKYIPLLDEVYKNASLTARPGGALVKQKQTLKRDICQKLRPVLN